MFQQTDTTITSFELRMPYNETKRASRKPAKAKTTSATLAANKATSGKNTNSIFLSCFLSVFQSLSNTKSYSCTSFHMKKACLRSQENR
eukprot:Awhi_evm1s15766